MPRFRCGTTATLSFEKKNTLDNKKVMPPEESVSIDTMQTGSGGTLADRGVITMVQVVQRIGCH
jgi:hypothetical protein